VLKKTGSRYAVGVVVAGVLAAGAAYGLPPAEPLWNPVTAGLRQTPAELLPAAISPHHPVRVVSTTLDEQGRPVVTVRTATDRQSAAGLVERGQRAERAVGVEIDVPVSAAGTDTYRESQWDFAELRVADAWPASTGAGVTVAVLDTGVDATHPDLVGQVLPGADLITGAGDAGDDPNGHGTHVAGVVAALTGNDLGVSSIAPDAKILPVRVLDAGGNGYLSTAAAGVVYAADHGADVINMSIAARTSEAALTNAIAYARASGVVVVAAAGNERGLGSPASYPAAEPGVIAVAATDSNDTVAGYSTAGDYVDVAAPGTNILSTFPVAKGYDFAYSSGTSMASPHVAAVAALLKALDRTLSPDQIEQAIETSATDLGTPGRDDDFGHGRIDAAAALATVAPVTVPADATPTASEPATDPDAPTTADPASAVPTADPASADPGSADPASADPASADPGSAGPASADPGSADPGSAGSASAGSASAGSASASADSTAGDADPADGDPAAGAPDPAPTEPVTAETPAAESAAESSDSAGPAGDVLPGRGE
jgi:type VII secretion-associated serine protease mycosin